MSTASRSAATAQRPRTRAVAPAFPIVEGKLSVPPRRPGLIPRSDLVDRLRRSGAVPIVAVVAPSGYGKTTLLAEWSMADDRPVAWLSLDERDNDPAVLFTYLAVGLSRIRPIDPEIFAALASPSVPGLRTVPARLVASLQDFDPSVLLILDDVHALTDPGCLDALEWLASRLPPGSQLAIGGRAEPHIRLAQRRAVGGLVEIGATDLALGHDDAVDLLRAATGGLPDATVERIVARTEGWPAGLYLAALSINAGGGVAAAESFTGEDRFLADYLRSEILDHLPAKELRFLIRTSVLERMCASLCDAVVGTRGSAAILERFEDTNLFLVPLDHHREWYRYHTLFRDLIRAELERREPGRAPELLSRAADWHERNGMIELAVEDLLEAGDAERAARLVATIAQPMYRSGRAATLERWFEWFETQGAVGEYAPLAVLVAWVRATTGAAADAARWADAAERAPAESPVFDGSPSIETWLSVLRALQCVHGVAQMRVDAERAARELPRTSFWHPTALALLGTAETLTGESGEAHLREALEAAESTGFHPNACFCLSQLGALAASHGDWATTRDLVARARALIDEARLDDYWTSGLVHALGARLAVRRGAASEASADLVRAQRLRSVLTHAIPWFAVQVRLELIRAHLGLADPAGARTLLREIDDILRRRSDLGTLSEHVEDVRRQVIAQPAGTAGASSLSAAELRLLPYLHTHLSFREIARRLFLSPNTVKTQAISLYRKLGVSSRGEAMTRAEELGLIDG